MAASFLLSQLLNLNLLPLSLPQPYPASEPILQELAVVVKEKDELYAQRTKHESLKREQLAGASASKEKQAQELRIVAVEVRH